MKKYEFTGETRNFFGRTLNRIRALVEIRDHDSNVLVVQGDLGGWIEREDNLSHEDNAWVFNNAVVSGNARVFGNASVCGDAIVSGNARVSGNAVVSDIAVVRGGAVVFGDARVCGNAEINKTTHFLTVSPIGSRNDITTFFRTKDNIIKVKCGCFLGTIPEFLSEVESTHGNNKHATAYRLAVELAKEQIELDTADLEEK